MFAGTLPAHTIAGQKAGSNPNAYDKPPNPNPYSAPPVPAATVLSLFAAAPLKSFNRYNTVPAPSLSPTVFAKLLSMHSAPIKNDSVTNPNPNPNLGYDKTPNPKQLCMCIRVRFCDVRMVVKG